MMDWAENDALAFLNWVSLDKQVSIEDKAKSLALVFRKLKADGMREAAGIVRGYERDPKAAADELDHRATEIEKGE